ncbi:Phosphotransferase enzyme family protein [Corynebacterium faecale]|uniref:phosphotransferase family protein n=1 Tax=Corynebacterium faecale TaxID=1758466 RepID=UPI0025B5E80B|nr:phosphotransferase [Corynebacterium faecale]WJY92385.1 Phosphotransferase enzyme family protein [Corynebacterium faecale]
MLSHEDIVEIAEDLLAKRYGGTQKLSEVERLGGSGTAMVLRARVANSPFLQQRSVVLKYIPATGDLFDDSALLREIVSYQFTTSLTEEVRPGPVILAYDIDKRIMVLSDSGNGDTFADLLHQRTGDQRMQILRNLGQSLGSLHAATADREADFDILMSRMLARYPATTDMQKQRDSLLPTAVEVGLQILEDTGIPIPQVVHDFARDAQRRLISGHHRAFTPFDLSPDNIIVAERTHFLDYEVAGFRDATFDVACVIAGFPQFVFSHPLSDDEADELIDAWVQEVRGIWPNVNNEDRLHARIVTALIGWALSSVALMQLGSIAGVATYLNAGAVGLEEFSIPRTHEEDELVRQDINETFTALQRFAARGADNRFPEVARFAGDVVQSLIGAER